MSEDFLLQLRELAERAAPADLEIAWAGASDDVLDAFERRWGRRLSRGLRSWLRVLNGALLGPGGIFGVRDASDFLAIEQYLSREKSWQEEQWVPVAGDGTGNYFIELPPDAATFPGAIAFIDMHEDPTTINRIVASDYLHFLRFIL